MSWCKIDWNNPNKVKIWLSPETLLKQNEAERTRREQQSTSGELQLQTNPADTAFQKTLAYTYNSLAWRQLLTSRFAEAEASLLRGFELDPTNKYLSTNLAPALLFQGKTEAAMQEYEKWKDLPLGLNGLPFYRDAFLADFLEFENAGIIPEDRKADVEMVRKMLGE